MRKTAAKGKNTRMELCDLNPPQQQAVRHGDSPLLVLAGAGTGKTMVVTHRIGHLMRERGVSPGSILAVTFTNKAAREMRDRVQRFTHRDARGLDIGTFHGMCGRILRQFGDRIGLDARYTIYDQDDALRLIKRCMADMKIDPQAFSPRALAHAIERWKNQGKPPGKVQPSTYDMTQRRAHDVYVEYARRCLDANAVDFGDMLLHVVQLLKRDAEVRDLLRQRWSHVLVDEYQDTNPVQYQLIEQLATPAHSLTVVGDDDQSIYRWRGADIGNILRFERDFPGATVIRLEQNYRSTQSILSAANAVIANNTSRKGKNLFTERGPGERSCLRLFLDERAEGEAIADRIVERLADGWKPQDFAVLYRINAQSRPVEDALRRRKVPYAVYSGIRFYDRMEIKNALAYLRLLVNPRSSIDFARVVNEPSRGIGKTSMERLYGFAAGRGFSLLEAATLVGGSPEQASAAGLRPKASKAFAQFAELIHGFRRDVELAHPARLLEEVLDASGTLAALEAEATDQGADRIENLQELVAAVDEYVAVADEPSLAGFLEEVTLVSDIDTHDPEAGQVSLMTLHSAKGLEFPMVFLPGMEEGLFPHSRSLNERAELEEERRLCYVGITRARRELVLSAARVRRVFGDEKWTQLSRFLVEIPEELLDLGAGEHAPPRRPRRERVEVGPRNDFAVEPSGARLGPEPSVYDQELGDPFAPGTRVVHATFGEGTVVSSRGEGKRHFLTIQFPAEERTKTIAARFVEPA